MALATRCPNCQALFRVVADQLKLRGGLVRCGACRHVFDAIGSLAYVDDSSTVSTAVPAREQKEPKEQRPRIAGSMASLLGAAPVQETPQRSAPAPAAPEGRRDEGRRDEARLGEPRRDDASEHPSRDDRPRDEKRSAAAARKPRPTEAEENGDGENNPLAVPTLLATHSDATVDLHALRSERDAEAPAEAEPDAQRAADDRGAEAGGAEVGQEDHDRERDDPARGSEDREHAERRRRRPERALAKQRRRVTDREDDAAGARAADAGEHGEEEPDFLRSERERRGFSVVFGGGSVLLSLLLIVQAAILFRTELVTRWPSLRPALVTLCGLAECTVSWPTRAELLAVVGTELQAIPGTDVLELRTVIRNRASFKVALPAIEVALTDTQNRTVARKVFAPVDYLSSSGEPASRLDEGLAAGSDYEVRIAFEARGIPAVGFVVYPFYL